MSLAIVITTTGGAHPDRAANASALQQQITRDWAALGMHPSLYACWLHTGDPPQGLWPDTRAALASALSAGYDHVLLLQDDVRLHPDFIRAAHDAIAARPEAIWSGFTRRRSANPLVHQGLRWAHAPILTNAPCVCYPAPLLHPMLTWIDAHVRPDFPSYDQRVSLWALATGLRLYYTLPCLVQHDEAAFGSVFQLPDPHRNRVAAAFDAASPLPDFTQMASRPLPINRPPLDRYGAWRA